MLHEQICSQAKSPALAKYIWECGVGPQMGYAFSYIHALAYSFIGYQTAYLATHWNPVYWNTACLIVNSGSLEDNSEETIVDIYAPENDDIEEGVTFKDLPDRSGKIKKTASANYEKIAKGMYNEMQSLFFVPLEKSLNEIKFNLNQFEQNIKQIF